MDIFYIGSQGVLSVLPLRVLLQHNVPVKAIVMLAQTCRQLETKPATLADIRVGDDESLSSSASLLEIAQQYQIPVIELSDNLKESAQTLRDLNIDVMLMSCFPRKLPAEIYQLAKFGCFNLHPSVLPAYRGPSPIHWQCAHKVTESGVTVHLVNAEFDQGDIAIQKIIKTRHCVNKVELAYKLALMGGEAFIELLEKIENNSLQLSAQPELNASYYGFPE